MNRFAAPIQLCKSTVSLLLCCTLFAGTMPAHAAGHGESAKKLFVEGQSAEAREDYDAAYEDYKKAYAKAPNDLRMRTAYYRLRQTASSTHVTLGRKMLDADKSSSPNTEQAALAQFMRATEIDPGNEAAIQEIAKLRSRETGVPVRSETSLSPVAEEAIDDAGAPAELKAVSNEPLTLRMTQDSKLIYQAIGKAAGINVLFDPDYNGKSISVELNNVTLMDALRIVGTLSNTFWRPVTSNTIFVAQNNRSKHTELDEQAVQTFYLSNAWQQSDLNDVQTALRNVMANAKVYGVPSQNAIVVRATPDELTLAQKIINDLDKARPEVVVDVAIMEVDRDKMRNIGLSWPGSISFALQPPQTTSTTTAATTTATSLTLDNLANLNANSFAVTVSSATANLLLSDSDTKILQNPRIRATDGQKATMKIGSRIPIATGSYQTGATTAITSSLVNTQFQYQDVGVQIEMTPTVHFDHDVTLKLKIEDTSESGTETISGVTEPIIAQKTSEQTIRLREGEASILAGILDKQDLVSISGIPGLGELPILKYIFGSKSHEVIDDEVVFVLIPHIVRGQDLSPLNLRRIDTGSGQTIELRHINDGAPRPVQPAQPAPIHPTGAQSFPGSTVAPLQGQTAAAAVNSAMQQLRQEATGDAPHLNTPPPAPAQPSPQPATQPAPPGSASFVVNAPTTPVTVGAEFPVSVMLNDAHGVSSTAFQIQYDPDKLTLVGFKSDDLLNQGGQQATVMHKDEPVTGSSLHTINIVGARPLGTPGVDGSGSICTLTFQAKQAGPSDLVVSSHSAVNSAQQPVPASAQNAHIVIQ